MCISSNSVNQAQDLMAVKKFDDLANKQIPTLSSAVQCGEMTSPPVISSVCQYGEQFIR